MVVEVASGDLGVGLGLEGVRSLEGEADLVASDGAGRLFLDFGAGNWGNDPMGGPVVGLDGCGSVDMMGVRPKDLKTVGQKCMRDGNSNARRVRQGLLTSTRKA